MPKVSNRISIHLIVMIALLMSPILCSAHVGSPDVYFNGQAGPYKLLITVRPPAMIPGIAQVEVRAGAPGVRSIQAVPLYIVGEGSKYPPTPDAFEQSKDDPQLFTGQLWIMGSGSWQVRLEANGAQGPGSISVPVPAFATRTLRMQKTLGAFLFAVMLVLVAAFVSIFGAGGREAFLDPGQKPGRAQSVRGVVVMAFSALLLIAILFRGNFWWDTVAASQAKNMIYKAPPLAASLQAPGKLVLRIDESKWHSRRDQTVMTALIPDHGHIMHLFLVRMPQMDAFEHLHPRQIELGNFVQQAPALPEGHYKIFADVVHSTGFPETYVGNLDLPRITSAASGDADDSGRQSAQPAGESSDLGDNDRMIWEKPSELRANQLLSLRFRVVDKNGVPATDLEPYMGMAGHAVIISTDGNVFAHVHPSGSVPMVSVELAQTGHLPPTDAAAMAVMPGMTPSAHMAPEVSFPWGFPRVGTYRVFVQVKRAGHVDTGVFEADVR